MNQQHVSQFLLKYWGDLIAVDAIFTAWVISALAIATAALVLGSTTKSGGWFGRGMLAVACTIIGYALTVGALTSAKVLITGH